MALETNQRLDFVFDSLCRKYSIKGASACIIVPDKGTWNSVFGESSNGVPIKTEMLMGISSNTKTFISALMLKLQESSKLSLDDTIGKWIINKKNINGKITIRQLLNHSSGLFDFTENPSFMDSINSDQKRIWKKESILEMVGNPYFKPGKGWEYSNTNYILAGIIIERVMNKPIETALQELIFSPLKLRNTYYYPQQIPDKEIAHQWTINIQDSCIDLASIGWSNNALFSMASSSGAIMQTAEDNAKFWHHLFSGNIINKNSLKQMMEFIATDDQARYGLGLYKYYRESALNNITCFGHGGTNFGFVNNNIVDSNSGICITVLTNQDSIDEDVLLFDLIANLHKVVLAKH